jgi:Protein of unknown function (DUF3313)
MTKSDKHVLTAFAALACLAVVACASAPLAKTENYSGFLNDYSQLKPGKDAKGEPIMYWVSPELVPGKYTKVIIDPVVFYPAAAPTKEVDAETLNQILKYYTDTLRQKIGARIPVVDQPGPGVARLKVAITAVATKNEPLKAYEYIPIALIVQGIKTVSGTRAQVAQIGTEMEVIDSQTSSRLAAVVKLGRGTRVTATRQGPDKGKHMVTLDDIKPLLDIWADAAAEFAGKNIPHQ